MAEIMQPARRRRMRVQGNNPHTVPAWSENLTQLGGQDREAKGKILNKLHLCNALLDENLWFQQSLDMHARMIYWQRRILVYGYVHQDSASL